MAKCGGSLTITNVTLTFDDAAASTLPYSNQIVSGTNRPTSYAVATPPFPPALTPAQPYSTNLSVFNGNNPNGAWSLYVIDDALGNVGVISNGWSLNVSIGGVVSAAADVGLAMTITNSPATVVTTSNQYYFLTLTNYGPSTATNIVVTDALPAGMAYVTNYPSLGNGSNSASVFTWSIRSLTNGAFATNTLILQATNLGTVLNAATVTTDTADLNPDDDTASVAVTVVSPTADLAISLVDSPDPLLLGSDLTYTITVSNLGPATATGVVVVDTLPPSVNFISASPTNSYVFANGVVTFTNLGNLDSGKQISVTITNQPTTAGTITDTASCRSGVIDPFKANNSASVKTIVQTTLLPVSLTVSRAGTNVALAWPTGVGNYNLVSTTNLSSSVSWTLRTNPPPQNTNGLNTVILPIGSTDEFFRLEGTP